MTKPKYKDRPRIYKSGKVKLVGGEVLVNVHSDTACAGEWCCIHNPSPHHMREWTMHWRSDRRIMERLCPDKGIGHPDPDDINKDGVHGCDGCCQRSEGL